MIFTILFIAASVIILVLAILATVAILDSNRQARYFEAAKSDLERALAGKEALKAENGTLQQELAHAQAHNADLSDALEKTRVLCNERLAECARLKAQNAALEEARAAKQSAPAKRAIRKSGMQASEEER